MSDFDINSFLPYLLNQAAEKTSIGFQPKYKERYGMLRTEWRVLFHLGKHGSVTATDVSVKASIHKTKVSRAVFDLCEKRFVTREESQIDRRQEILHLTKTGKAAYLYLVEEARKFDEQIIEKIGTKDAENLKLILQKLT